MRYIVSACLMGAKCKYNGGSNACKELSAYLKDHTFRCVCPEVLGGLPVPRACVEIQNGRFINTDHDDVSDAFLAGADSAAETALQFQADAAILQSRSPSCGVHIIYSGNFDGRLITGNGIFTQKLIEHKIPVYDVQEFIREIQYKHQNK